MSLIDALIESGLVKPEQRGKLIQVINTWLMAQIHSGVIKELSVNTFMIRLAAMRKRK